MATTTKPPEASPLHDLTGFQRDILAVVEDAESPHGLAVKGALEEAYNEEINHGRLYPNLDTLVNKGLLQKGQRDRRTNWYQLTDRGKREIVADREWRGKGGSA